MSAREVRLRLVNPDGSVVESGHIRLRATGPLGATRFRVALGEKTWLPVGSYRVDTRSVPVPLQHSGFEVTSSSYGLLDIALAEPCCAVEVTLQLPDGTAPVYSSIQVRTGRRGQYTGSYTGDVVLLLPSCPVSLTFSAWKAVVEKRECHARDLGPRVLVSLRWSES